MKEQTLSEAIRVCLDLQVSPADCERLELPAEFAGLPTEQAFGAAIVAHAIRGDAGFARLVVEALGDVTARVLQDLRIAETAVDGAWTPEASLRIDRAITRLEAEQERCK